MADTRRLRTYLGVQGVLAVVSFLLPDAWGAALRLAVAAVGIAVLLVAVLVRRPKRRAGWWLIALGGCLTYAAALAIFAVYGPGWQQVASLPKLVLVLVAALAMAIGLAVLGWRSRGGRWDTLDTAITSTAAFLLLWVFYIDPHLSRSASRFATVVAIAIPASALLVFGMAVKLAFCGGLSTWAGRMLLLATVAGLCTSVLVAGPIGAPSVPINLPIRAAWLAEAILYGASGLAPGFTDVVGSERRRPPAIQVPFGRLVLFIVLALVAPLNVALGSKQAGTPGPVIAAIVVPPICGTLILLILVTRLFLVGKIARRRAEELSERSASLARALARQDELQGELAYRALHDPLTGLANRDALAERIEGARESRAGAPGRRSGGQALIMVDLDGFKTVNDTLGHSAGDKVLVDVSQRLTAVLPDAAVVARLGGDEFAVLLESTPRSRARRAAEGVREALRAPYFIDGRQVGLTASVGLLVVEPGGQPTRYAEGLRETDRAMYAAKAAGGNRVIEVGAAR